MSFFSEVFGIPPVLRPLLLLLIDIPVFIALCLETFYSFVVDCVLDCVKSFRIPSRLIFRLLRLLRFLGCLIFFHFSVAWEFGSAERRKRQRWRHRKWQALK